MGTVGLQFEILNKDEVPAMREALLARTQAAVRQGAADGTAGRFLEHQTRLRLASQRMQLTVFDRSGNIVSRVGEPASYTQPAFSPDGTKIVAIRTEPESGNQGVWTLDVATGKATAVTSDDTAKSAPVWSPDGKQIAYVVSRDNVPHIYRKSADGTGAEELLYRNSGTQGLVLTDWSADGRFLCFWAPNDTMYLLPVDNVDGERKPIELKRPDFVGRGGRLSPDGKYLAYNSNASGKFEVYVRQMDAAANASSSAGQISKDGGVGGIVWRRDGKEIFYLSGNAIMAVDVGSGPSQAGTPTQLFRFPTPIGAPAQLSTIVSADGQRFVQAVAAPRSPSR
jgi:eukaryotic-like serine/threonine-protein kinase